MFSKTKYAIKIDINSLESFEMTDKFSVTNLIDEGKI